MSEHAPQLTVENNPAATRYDVRVDGALAGFARYRLGEGVVVFVHTEIGDEYAGQGVGSVLARAALDDVRARGERVVARCPFIAAYIARHPEYQDLLAPDS